MTDLTPQENLTTADTDPTLLARKDTLIWKARAEAAEAERDRLAARVAELQEGTNRDSERIINLQRRLQQATEALREARRDILSANRAGFDSTRVETTLVGLGKIDRVLAALAGEGSEGTNDG